MPRDYWYVVDSQCRRLLLSDLWLGSARSLTDVFGQWLPLAVFKGWLFYLTENEGNHMTKLVLFGSDTLPPHDAIFWRGIMKPMLTMI